jgi:hypothetical protein
MTIVLFTCPSVPPSVRLPGLSSVSLSVCRSVCLLAACLSVCLSVCFPACLLACVPACMFACLPFCLYSACLPAACLHSACLSGLSSFLSSCLPDCLLACLPALKSVCLSLRRKRERYDQWPQLSEADRHGLSMRVRSAPNELRHRALVAGLPANPSLFKSMCRPRYS